MHAVRGSSLREAWPALPRPNLTFALGSGVVVLGAAFVAAGVGIGAAETAENAAVAGLAPTELRGSASGDGAVAVGRQGTIGR